MEPEDTPPMSGSNSMCVATVLLETGIVPMQEPETPSCSRRPGGLVAVPRAAAAKSSASRCESAVFCRPAGCAVRSAGPGDVDRSTPPSGATASSSSMRTRWVSAAPRRSERHRSHGRKDHARRRGAAALRLPGRRGLGPRVFLPDAAPLLRGRRAVGLNAVAIRPGQDRPVALRHRLFGPDGGAARTRSAEDRRPVYRSLDPRRTLRLQHRGRIEAEGGVPPSFRRSRPAPGSPECPAHARPDRSLAARLPTVGHLAQRGQDGAREGPG